MSEKAQDYVLSETNCRMSRGFNLSSLDDLQRQRDAESIDLGTLDNLCSSLEASTTISNAMEAVNSPKNRQIIYVLASYITKLVLCSSCLQPPYADDIRHS